MANGLGVGQDVITQRFVRSDLRRRQPGIGSITVEAALTTLSTDTPVYSIGNVAVERAEIAVFDQLRVSVVGV